MSERKLILIENHPVWLTDEEIQRHYQFCAEHGAPCILSPLNLWWYMHDVLNYKQEGIEDE